MFYLNYFFFCRLAITNLWWSVNYFVMNKSNSRIKSNKFDFNLNYSKIIDISAQIENTKGLLVDDTRL